MLSVDMWKEGLLQRCHSTVMHIVFGSLLSLMYRMLDSAEREGMEAAVKAIVLGRKVMASLAQFNTRAERGQSILTVSCNSSSVQGFSAFANSQLRS